MPTAVVIVSNSYDDASVAESVSISSADVAYSRIGGPVLYGFDACYRSIDRTSRMNTQVPFVVYGDIYQCVNGVVSAVN